jgi:predicted HAD superfamily phosphohydrolase YqeG
MDSANDISNRINNSILTKVQGEIDEVYDSLVVQQNRNTLPEAIFVNHFLPFFSGEKPNDPQNNILQQWVSVAGNATAEVAVVNEKNEVIYNVPALLDTDILNIANNNASRSFSQIYDNYKIRAKNIPAVGEKFLSDALSDKFKDLTTNNETGPSENEVRWNSIFERYGKLNKNSQSSKTSEGPEEDVTYD